MATRVLDIENRLWRAADELWANSNPSSQEYSSPMLGLILLKYADFRYSKAIAVVEAEIAAAPERMWGAMDPANMVRAREVMLDPKSWTTILDGSGLESFENWTSQCESLGPGSCS